MPNEATGDSRPIAEAAAASITPDPQTADILARHSKGEKLSAQEYGKLGGWKRWFGIGKTVDAAKSALPASQPGNAAPVAAVAPAETSPGVLPVIEIDDGLCKRTTKAVLSRADAWAVGFIEREAKAAGAAGDTLDRFRRAASLPAADQNLLVEISPDVFRELGLDPRQFAVWTALGVLGFHGFNLWQCVGELREMRKQTVQASGTSTPETAVGPGQSAPKPAVTAAAKDKIEKAAAPAVESKQPIATFKTP